MNKTNKESQNKMTRLPYFPFLGGWQVKTAIDDQIQVLNLATR